MKATLFLALFSGGLVFLAGLLGGASLAGAALRSLGAVVLFGALGLLVQALWRASATQAEPAGGGGRLDQVLPAPSPADLFEPLNPPVITRQDTKE